MAEKILTHKEFVERLYQAALHFYPLVFDPNANPWDQTNFTDEVGTLTQGVFRKQITEITGISDISAAINKLNIVRGLSSEQLERSIPTITQIESMVSYAEARGEQQKASVEKAKADVQRSIEQKQKAHLTGRVYAKVEAPQKEAVQGIENASENIKKNPAQAEKDLAEFYKAKITPALQKQMSQKDIDYLAQKAAKDTVDGILNPEKYAEITEQAAILSAIAGDEGVMLSQTQNEEELKIARDSATEVALGLLSYQTSKNVAEAVSPSLAAAAFGPNVSKYRVTLLGQSSPELRGVKLNNVVAGAASLQEKQIEIFNKIAGSNLTVEDFLRTDASKILENQIANLPQGTSPQAYRSDEFKAILFQISEVRVVEVETAWTGKLALAPTASPFFESFAGVSFATQASALSSTVNAAEIAAAKAIGAKVGTAAAAVVQAALPGIGKIIAPAVKKIVGDLASNIGIFISKHKGDVALAGVGILGLGLAFGSIPLIAAGAGIIAIGGAVGATFANFLAASAAFIATIGSFVISGILMPLIGTLVGLPILIILVLFIINSGAYVVPPGVSTGTVSITCNATKSEGQTIQTSGSSIANAAVCIVSYLNQLHLNPLFKGMINSPAWRQLANILPAPALNQLELSAPVDGHLQCVGFADAAAAMASGRGFAQINACSYIGKNVTGFKYVDGTKGMKPGDLFLIDGKGGCSNSSPGHIGVVISVDGVLISCADANMIAPGKARVAHGCFALSQIAGYLTPTGSNIR